MAGNNQQTTTSRRGVLIGGTLAAAAASLPAAAAESFWTARYTAKKGDVTLAMYRKRLHAPHPGGPKLPVLFLVHGSSVSALPSFDLTVPGAGEYSLMNVFARYGFDVWTLDFEGYGKSTVTSGNSDVASGVEDLKAAMPVLQRETGLTSYCFMGESSGAIRAAAFAAAEPARVDRLVLVGPAAHGMFPAALLAELQHEAMAPLWTLPGFDRLLQLGLRHGAYKHLPIDDHYMAHFLAPLRSPGAVAVTLRIARYFRNDLQELEPLLPLIRAPVLLIWGRHDRLIPRRIVRHVMRRVPQTRLSVYAASGHCPQEEEPERFTAEVLAFLQETR